MSKRTQIVDQFPVWVGLFGVILGVFVLYMGAWNIALHKEHARDGLTLTQAFPSNLVASEWRQLNDDQVRLFVLDASSARVSMGCNLWGLEFRDGALTGSSRTDGACGRMDESAVELIFRRRVIGVHVRQDRLNLLRKGAPPVTFVRST